MTTLVGILLNERYRIESYLGSGIGERYRGVDTSDSTGVLMTVFTPTEQEFPTLDAQLHQAVPTYLDLDHPSLPKFLDVGRYGDAICVITRVTSGQPLPDYFAEQTLSQSPLAAPDAVALLKPIADALDYLHTQDLVYGNLRPETIIRQADGGVTLLDVYPQAFFSLSEIKALGVRNTGYLSPEQHTGRAPTAASDRYSLAVLAHELLIGKPPTSESALTPGNVVHAVLAEGLTPTPDARYPSAAAFVTALEQAALAQRWRQIPISEELPAPTPATAAVSAPPSASIPATPAIQTAAATAPKPTSAVTPPAAQPVVPTPPAPAQTGNKPTSGITSIWAVVGGVAALALCLCGAVGFFVSQNSDSITALFADTPPTAVPPTPVPTVAAVAATSPPSATDTELLALEDDFLSPETSILWQYDLSTVEVDYVSGYVTAPEDYVLLGVSPRQNNMSMVRMSLISPTQNNCNGVASIHFSDETMLVFFIEGDTVEAELRTNMDENFDGDTVTSVIEDVRLDQDNCFSVGFESYDEESFHAHIDGQFLFSFERQAFAVEQLQFGWSSNYALDAVRFSLDQAPPTAQPSAVPTATAAAAEAEPTADPEPTLDTSKGGGADTGAAAIIEDDSAGSTTGLSPGIAATNAALPAVEEGEYASDLYQATAEALATEKAP